MEKTNKDYIAVPTSEPPLYQEEEQVEVQQPKRGRRFKFFLIGGAIALIGLGHLCKHKYNEFSAFSENSFDLNLFEYPKEIANVETGNDLNEFMRHLDSSFGRRPCRANFNHGPPHEPHGPPHGPPSHGPSPHEPHGPHEPKEPKELNDFTKEENIAFNNEPKEFDGEGKLDSHRKHHGFNNHHQNEETQEFDDERNFDNHGFPEHHNKEEAQNSDMLPPPHPHGMHGFHHSPPPPGLALLFDGDKKSPPPHPENICKVDILNATSTVYSFSPDQFQKTSVSLDGFFSHGGKVSLSKSSDKSIQDVRINVTMFHGNENLIKQVVLSAFDHKGKYHVEIKRDHHGHGRFGPAPPHHRHDKNETINDCLVYAVNIEFPENLDYFDGIGLHIKGAHSIGGDLDNIEFGSVKAGLGHGVINFENLKAKKVKLGVLGGVIVGNYHVGESISAGSIHGGIKLNVFPTGENVNVTTSSIFGPSILNIPSESYAGKFFVSSFSGDSTIQADEPEDVHVTKMRPFSKNGYFKEDKDESNIFVSSKNEFATLKFN